MITVEHVLSMDNGGHSGPYIPLSLYTSLFSNALCSVLHMVGYSILKSSGGCSSPLTLYDNRRVKVVILKTLRLLSNLAELMNFEIMIITTDYFNCARHC